jgi:hypothetical protein
VLDHVQRQHGVKAAVGKGELQAGAHHHRHLALAAVLGRLRRRIEADRLAVGRQVRQHAARAAAQVQDATARAAAGEHLDHQPATPHKPPVTIFGLEKLIVQRCIHGFLIRVARVSRGGVVGLISRLH